MSDDRWARAATLFDMALDLNPEDREQFLNDRCRDEPLIRELIAKMLETDAQSGEKLFLNPPLPATAMGLLLEYADSALLGERVGKYRLVEKVASGGMGTVFRAVADGDPDPWPVAVKLIRRGMDTAEGVRRFQLEREALARLDHPGIAKLLDGGITDRGQPYLVMEYLDGLPIDAYCDENELDLPARIRLVQSVCSAIEYAHRSLIVHRDIKPSNVLVTGEGVPKLLDFGISKLLNGDGDAPPQVTATSLRIITPLYASPEAIRGRPASTAMDVYSLGVLLFELLTGRAPFDLERRSSFEAQKMICELDPPLPSNAVLHGPETGPAQTPGPAPGVEAIARARGTTPRELSRALQGELDTIVLSALHKDPERRYLSVEQLAEDLNRHLSGFPIRATGDSFRYRAGKFIRRNPAAVTIAALAMVSLAIGIGGVAFGLVRAKAEAARARLEAIRAEQISAFLQETLTAADPEVGGSDITVRQVLDRAADRIDREFELDLDMTAAARQAIGAAYAGLGLYPEAELHLRAALSNRRTAFGESDPLVAESASNLGRVLRIRGSYTESEALLRLALQIDRSRYGDVHAAVARDLNWLGTLHVDKSNFVAAEQAYREALEVFRALGESESSSYAIPLAEYGTILTYLGRSVEGLQLCRESLDIHERQFGQESVHYSLSLRELATSFQIVGDLEAAENAYREALAIDRKLRGDLHPSVSRILNNLGVMFSQQGRRKEATEVLREALVLRRKLFGDTHISVAVTMANLSVAFERPEDGESLLRESLSMSREIFGDADHRLADSLHNLAQTLAARKEFDEAEPLFYESLQAYRAMDGLPPRTRSTYPLVGLGLMLLQRGDPVSAEPLLREAVQIRRETGMSPEDVGNALSVHGAALTELAAYEEAESSLVEALELLEPLGSNNSRADVVSTIERLADMYEKKGMPEKAVAYRERLSSLQSQ